MKAIPVAEVVHAAEFDPKPPGFWSGFSWFAPAVAMLLAVTLYPTATFGLYRYRGLKAAVANDLAWAPAPSVAPNDKHTVYGFQLCINSNSPRQGGAWEFVKFMASPAAQAIAARGGEVVARASAYKDAYFKTPEAEDQLGWKTLVQTRGRMVNYSLIQSTFNQICGEAFQRMILRDPAPAPAAVALEVRTRYAHALAKS